MQKSRSWVAVALILSLVSAPVLAAEPEMLPKPEWARCTWNGETYNCLNLDQSKHYLTLFTRYKDQHAYIKLLENELEVKAKYEAVFIEDINALTTRVEESNRTITAFQEFIDRPDPTPYSFSDVVIYVGASLLAGFSAGILVDRLTR